METVINLASNWEFWAVWIGVTSTLLIAWNYTLKLAKQASKS